jgi:hypothetical protein
MEKISFWTNCKYSCSLTYIAVEASSVCTEDGWKDVLQVIFCVLIRKTISVHTKREKPGLGGCELEDRREGGRVSSSSYVSSDAKYFSSSLSESITISRIWFWDSRRASFIRETSRYIEKNCSAATGYNSTISTERSRNFCEAFGGNFSFPYLRTVTQLPVNNTIRFYDPNIPFFLLNARLN